MEKLTTFILFWNFLQSMAGHPVLDKARDSMFTLYPPHVWSGEVRSREITTTDAYVQPALCVEGTSWNLAEANTICFDLGFSEGAMTFGRRKKKVAARQTIQCIFFNEESFCRRRHEPCAEVGWVSCQFPGFLGCFEFDPNTPPFSEYVRAPGNEEDMTIGICTARCRARKPTQEYAGLEDGNRCYCGNIAPVGFRQADRSECLTPCNDDERQACGGIGHISVYEARLGSCGGTYATTDVRGYLTSPGFPGDYVPSTNCRWMFIMPNQFNETLINIMGMDLTQAESLHFLSYGPQFMATSDTKWQANDDNDVKRGEWSLDLNKGTTSIGIGIVFASTSLSRGNKHFLLSFAVNNVSKSTPPSTTQSTLSDSTIGNPNAVNGLFASDLIWILSIILSIVLLRG